MRIRGVTSLGTGSAQADSSEGSSKMRWVRHARSRLSLIVALAAWGCSSVDQSAAPGELGNGYFFFSCDDAISCSRYSNDAAKFPSLISLGSKFSIRFASNASPQSSPEGATVLPVGPFVSRGPEGFAAIKTGYETMTARNVAGQVVDFKTIRIVRPNSLVVYAAEDPTDAPKRIDAVPLRPTDRKSFRAFAQHDTTPLAGSLAIEWTSSDRSIFDIESTIDGKVTVVAKARGSARLIVVGGSFEQQIPVTVSP